MHWSGNSANSNENWNGSANGWNTCVEPRWSCSLLVAPQKLQSVL